MINHADLSFTDPSYKVLEEELAPISQAHKIQRKKNLGRKPVLAPTCFPGAVHVFT